MIRPDLQEPPAADAPWWDDALVSEPVAVLAILLGVLALIFALEKTRFRVVYRFVPILVFCYFVPTLLSNTGVLPSAPPTKDMPGFPLYEFTMDWLLPASLLLLILAADIIGILRLGRNAVVLFLVAAVSIVIGGPLAYLALGSLVPPEQADQAWRGLAALSGSWIGGGANFTAIGESVGTSSAMLGVIIVVDVAIANLWMIALLYFAGTHRRMDEKIGADSSTVDEVERKAEEYAVRVAAPTDLPALLILLAVAIGGTVLCTEAGSRIDAGLHGVFADDHWVFDILRPFTWKILLVTGLGVALSFTGLRKLEGKGASKVGSVFLYLLVASIGAKADFAKILDPDNLPLLAIGALWMAFHITVILTVRHLLRAPIFFAAVGSKACIGGAASAPIVAAAFSPSLAPVGVLIAIGGYILGTVGGLACAFGLKWVSTLYGG